MGKTYNRETTEPGIAFISTTVTWDIPNDGTPYNVQVPITNMRDDLNFEIPNDDVTVTIADILPGGYVLTITIPNTVSPSSLSLIVITPGGSTNMDLQGQLAGNEQLRILAVTGSFAINGNDDISGIPHFLGEYLSGEEQEFGGRNAPSSISNVLIDANTIVYFPIFIEFDCSIDALVLRGIGGPVGNFTIGLYNLTSDLVSGNKIFQTSEGLTSLNQQTLGIAQQFLKAGYYLACFHSSQAYNIGSRNNYINILGKKDVNTPRTYIKKILTYSGVLPEYVEAGTSFVSVAQVPRLSWIIA